MLAGPVARLLIMAAAALPAAALSQEAVLPSLQWEPVARCGGFLEAPTRLPSGDLAVSDPLGGRILRVDRDGQCHLISQRTDLPNGQALAEDGRLIVARRGGLVLVDPTTGDSVPLVSDYDGEPLGISNDLSPDSHGGIYFTVPGSSSILQPDGRVFYLPAGRAPLELVASGLAFPNGIAVAPDGDSVFVAEFAAKRILRIPTRHSRRQFNVPHVFALTKGGVGPDGLAVGGDGTLYAAIIEAGRIARWSADGQPLPDLVLPPEAGLLVTNILIEGDWLYATEAAQGRVWRVALRPD